MFVAAVLLLFIADGSRQPTSGAGWRLLGYQRGVAAPADIVPVTSQADLDAIWDRMLIRTAPARLPPDASTFWVTATGSMGCPAHFAGFEAAPARITVVFTSALTTGCDRLKVPDSFLVSIDDSQLPDGAFQLTRTGPPGQPDAVLEVKP